MVMATWSQDELRKIGEADDLHISPFREDGMTYGTPTWIWSVVIGNDLYARAQRGTFEPVDGPINDRIDEAYRAKYGSSEYLSPMIGARARSATVKVMPRETNA
jgi:hypothetical protein